MKYLTFYPRPAIVALLTSAALFAACSRPAPEEQLIEAGQDVSDAQSRLASVNSSIQEHQDAILELSKERKRLRDSLLTLEERLQQRATDLAIFRAAQTALLNSPQLRQAAVMVSVDEAIVTLTGVVGNDEQQRLASDIVKSVPGVKSTVNRLEIENEQIAAGN